MAEQDEQQGSPSPQESDQEWLQNYLSEHQGQLEPGARISPPEKKKKPEILLLLAGVLVLAFGVTAVLMTRNGSGKPSKKDLQGDLGQGVVIASGLRGHLVTDLREKTVHYKLKIEPIALPEQESFGRETASNTDQFYFNVRVLDPVGDPVCGKQIVLPAVNNNAVAPGADAFQRIKGDKGTIDALWAEGTLPCSADQFARFSYWDFATDFPTVEEQDRKFGVDHRAQTDAPKMTAAQAAAARRRAAQKLQKPQTGFFLQGDDHISSFEPGRNVLVVGPGRSFIVLRAGDLATASAWADDAALVHYTCNQQATCILHRAGSAATIVARRMN